MSSKTTEFQIPKYWKKALTLGLAAAIGMVTSLPRLADASPGKPVEKPSTPARTRANNGPAVDRQDILLIMPNAKAEKEEMSERLKEANATVIGEMGQGDLKVLVVLAEHGKAGQTQKKLRADQKDFDRVDCNHLMAADYVPMQKDPSFPDSWHLFRMHCPDAWDSIVYNARNKEMICILDTGCQGPEIGGSRGADVTGIYKDIAKKLKAKLGGLFGTGLFGSSVADQEDNIIHWGNLAETMTLGIFDRHGHGTWVASTAAGHENGVASLGINPRTAIYPIKIADAAAGQTAYTDDLAEVAAMMVVIQTGLRIVNISYGGVPDKANHSVLHELFKFYHDKKNGLVFTSAGNSGQALPYNDVPYLNVVSAMEKVDSKMLLADKSINNVFSSNYGNCVDFTAPGSVIDTCGPDGKPVTVYGTSFSSPIVAGVASLIWSVNPGLSNKQVETILRASCQNTTPGRNSQFGWGMPDAQKAVQMAKGSM